MYLTKLYRYNKWLFTGIVFFAAMQLLVTYKRGMVISPWYNYGMYSEKIYPQKTYEVNKKLTGSAWLYLVSPQYDDKVDVTLDNYRKISTNDSLYHKEITRLFAKMHLPVPATEKYECKLDRQAFNEWFENNISHTQDLFIHAFKKSDSTIRYEWNGQHLMQK